MVDEAVSGLTVHWVLDRRAYPTKVKISDAQMRTIHVISNTFHGEWNYTIRPKRQ
jgi:hypothetical protein